MPFELTQIRAFLLIFPNTFEYFFDFYEGVRARWDPRRMSQRLVIGAAAFIWIFIKLPQEWWIHVAQLDTTDIDQGGHLRRAGDRVLGRGVRSEPDRACRHWRRCSSCSRSAAGGC